MHPGEVNHAKLSPAPVLDRAEDNDSPLVVMYNIKIGTGGSNT